mgnify:FL=1
MTFFRPENKQGFPEYSEKKKAAELLQLQLRNVAMCLCDETSLHA